MNRQIRRVGLVLVACFVALVAQLTYLQVVAADRLAHHAGNVRSVVADYSRPRGSIVTADGVIVARSVPSGDQFKLLRTYPAGPTFAHVSGFFSFTLGATGVEAADNRDLTGRAANGNFGDWVTGRQHTGDVVLTISDVAQRAAQAALRNRRGSVVVLDPRTGAVLALWSSPSYDPNPLAGHSGAAVKKAFDGYNADPAKPMLARAYRERYPAGSTFKVVTAATALEDKVATPDSTYPVLRSLTLPETTKELHNFGGEACGGTLAQSFVVSCNTTFGRVGLQLGERLASGVEAFGIGDAVPFDLPAARSVGPTPGTFRHDMPGFADAAIGQGDVAVTPLQMAMVAAAIADGGVMMRPYVTALVRGADGTAIRRTTPSPWKQAVSAPTAAAVAQMMIQVVARGTGTPARIPGVTVAGKTGTAQAPGGPPHAWFIGFAPAEAPRFAFAVLVERGGDQGNEATGGKVAAPVAKAVLQALLAPPAPSPVATPADGSTKP